MKVSVKGPGYTQEISFSFALYKHFGGTYYFRETPQYPRIFTIYAKETEMYPTPPLIDQKLIIYLIAYEWQ